MDRVKKYDTLFVKKGDEEGLKKAADFLASGEVVGFPTETVYGLGADAFNGEAVKKIFEAKGRPGDNPLIVHIWDKSQIEELTSSVTPVAKALIDAFMPGPVTVIMNKSDKIPDEVTAGLNTVGIRMPSHPVAREFLKLCACPVAAPSANLSGSPSPTTALHVMNDMDGYVSAVVDGGSSDVGLESTVIDATGDEPVILRPGAITGKMIEDAVKGGVTYAGAVSGDIVPPSPGMKYRHYAPSCAVETIMLPSVTGDVNLPENIEEADKLSDEQKKMLFAIASPFIMRAQEIIKNNPAARIGVFAGNEVKELFYKLGDEILLSHINFYVYGATLDVKAASHGLFDGLRLLDRQEVNVILASGFKGDDLEVAYMNRLSKACAKAGDDVPSHAYEQLEQGGSEVPLDYFDELFTASVLFVSGDDINLGAVCEGTFTEILRGKGPYCSSEDTNVGAELYAESAGLYATDGIAPDEELCKAYREVMGKGIDHHRSKRVSVELYDGSDLILTIRDEEAFELLSSFPDLEGRVFSLSSYMASKGLVIRGEDGRIASISIPDPTGENYAACLHTVSAVKAWLEILFPYIIADLGAQRFC